MPNTVHASESDGAHTYHGVFAQLVADHRRIRERMVAIESTAYGVVLDRDGAFEELEKDLIALAHAEEEALYQNVELYESTADLVMLAREQTELISHVLAELALVREDEPRWLARFQLLSELVERHFQAEEAELFALAADLLGRARAFLLLDDLEDARAHALARLEFRGIVRTQRDDRMLRETSVLPN